MHGELGDSVAWCSCGYRSPAISKTRTHWDSVSNNSDPVRWCAWGPPPGSFAQWHSNGADEAQKDCHTVGREKNILEFTVGNCSREEGFLHSQLPQAEPVNRACELGLFTLRLPGRHHHASVSPGSWRKLQHWQSQAMWPMLLLLARLAHAHTRTMAFLSAFPVFSQFS